MKIDKLTIAKKQKLKQEKLGNICIQHGINEVDLFLLIRDKKAKEDKKWTE